MSTYTRMIERHEDTIKELEVELESPKDVNDAMRILAAINHAQNQINECRHGDDNV